MQKFLLKNMIFFKNKIKYNKSLSFLLIFWDKENEFLLLMFRDGGSIYICGYVLKIRVNRSLPPVI